MTGYSVVIEREGNAWGAYVAELPGCVATGATREEVESRIREAIPAHLALMREAGEDLPSRPPVPSSSCLPPDSHALRRR
ncbi:MAG: type II toxin-antitoxin system HicB family antitoxin [Acidimicrobiales bacterium]